MVSTDRMQFSVLEYFQALWNIMISVLYPMTDKKIKLAIRIPYHFLSLLFQSNIFKQTVLICLIFMIFI